MDLRKLKSLTIVAPIAFLLLVELLGLFVLQRLIESPGLRLLVVFALLAAGAIPFSTWIFNTIERQQRDLLQAANLLDSVKDYAIFALDPQGRVMSWTPGAQSVKGYEAEEIIGEHVSCFYLPEDVASGQPERNLEIASRIGQARDEGWRLHKDGTRFWAEVLATAVRDDQGNLLGFTHVVRDMTERKRAEEHIHTLNAELERRVEELAAANKQVLRRNRELAAVNSAMSSISRALDLSHVLQNIVDAARDLVQSRYAALGVANDEGHIVEFMTSGITPEERTAIGPLPQGHGLLGTLIKEATPLRIANLAEDPRSSGFPPNHPVMTSLLGVPILFQGKSVGDLYLTDKIGADEFSEEDQALLMLLAGHAAVAIENARLYEEVRAARDQLQAWNEQLEAKVFERTREIQRYSQELTTRVLQAQEEERKRIARELHDETAQSLSTLLINLDLLEPLMPPEGNALRSGIERVRELAQRTLDETRALSHALRPTILDDFGLAAALRWFADEFSQTFGVPVDVRIESAPAGRLDPELELTLFRIAQEALTNSGKYAEAQCARLELSFPDGDAQLIVEDNGRGFNLTDVRGPTRHGGLGLYGMRERAALLGATLDIHSAPGAGTRITVKVPRAGQGIPARAPAFAQGIEDTQ